MLTQTALLAPDERDDDDATDAAVVHQSGLPIVVPCGFRDRHNNPCQRRGNWPILDGKKQMLCRGRPMVHRDPACFRGNPPAPDIGSVGEDVVWDEVDGADGDIQPR